jgi:thioredoxin reductase (NADPH)
MSVLVIEKMSVGGQMALTGDIENYPGIDSVDGFELGMKMQAQAQRWGAETLYDEVVGVDFTGEIKVVKTAALDYLAKTVVIATGAYPRELGIIGERENVGRGVHYCAHCDGRFYKDKTVAVVGGGDSVVTDALYLKNLAKKVYLIHRRDSLRATKVYRNKIDSAENIEFIKTSVIDAIDFNEERKISVKSLRDESIQDIKIDGLFVSIGRAPSTKLFEGKLNIDKNGYRVADESTRTNIGGVYAVGDVRTKDLRQVITAAADGAVAAYMADEYINEFM